MLPLILMEKAKDLNKGRTRKMKLEGISKKIYLELQLPTEEDSRSAQQRILDGLEQQEIQAKFSLGAMKNLYPLCERAGWKVTVSLAWNGELWMITDLEQGDTAKAHYGVAVDLGSTTVVGRMIQCDTGECLAEVSVYNRQIPYGTDILNRIFYCKDQPGHLEELRQATVDSISGILEKLEEETGISPKKCIQMVIAGNTTMLHFLLGLDAFCVFSTPYAVWADRPGFLRGKDLGIAVNGFVYCCPGKSNYLGGDIISGIVATGMHREKELCAFFDIGTNGELVVGGRDFLLCGAGAAGPALEGGVVKTGMRAVPGAVDRVLLENGEFSVHVLGEGKAEGICGSGIVDLLAQLFLNGWINMKGTLEPEKSPLIQKQGESYAVEYAPGLFFYQEDIDEFLRTKAAAYTMVEYMLQQAGISLQELDKFYVAGAFGKHVSVESAVTIGMYPDMDRDKLISAGNASLEGAVRLLTDRQSLLELDGILEKMVYVQFGAVEDFLHLMVAAQAIPHTDLERYPSVKKSLQERKKA